MQDMNFSEQIQVIWNLGIQGKVLLAAFAAMLLFIIWGVVNVALETYADFRYEQKLMRNSAKANHPASFVADSTDDIWGD